MDYVFSHIDDFIFVVLRVVKPVEIVLAGICVVHSYREVTQHCIHTSVRNLNRRRVNAKKDSFKTQAGTLEVDAFFTLKNLSILKWGINRIRI